MPESIGTESGWYFEDFEVGQRFQTMSRTPTESEMMTFVGLGGFFEELWINTRKAESTTLGRSRPVPGILTLVLAEGLYLLTGKLRNGLALLQLEDVRWSAPVAVGDAIHGLIDVTAVRRSRSNPGAGIVTAEHHIQNHDGVDVLTYHSIRLVRAHTVEGAAQEETGT